MQTDIHECMAQICFLNLFVFCLHTVGHNILLSFYVFSPLIGRTILKLPPLHWSEIKTKKIKKWAAAAGTSDCWLEARHTSMYNTHTHTHNSENTPIPLRNPNLSKSTLCPPLGFPPLSSSLSQQLLLLQHSSFQPISSSSSCSLHHSCLFSSFLQTCEGTDELSAHQIHFYTPIPVSYFKKKKKSTGMNLDASAAIDDIQPYWSTRLYTACNTAYTFILKAEQK